MRLLIQHLTSEVQLFPPPPPPPPPSLPFLPSRGVPTLIVGLSAALNLTFPLYLRRRRRRNFPSWGSFSSAEWGGMRGKAGCGCGRSRSVVGLASAVFMRKNGTFVIIWRSIPAMELRRRDGDFSENGKKGKMGAEGRGRARAADWPKETNGSGERT